MKKILLIVPVLFAMISFAQDSTAYEKFLSKHRSIDNYIKFLQPDEKQKNEFFIATHSMVYTNTGKILHGGRGSYITIGLNLARFFSKKIVLGVGVDLRCWKGLWDDRFTNGYINDFNANFNNTIQVIEDSARATALKETINGGRYYARGSYYSALVLSFAPYPMEYGGFMLNLKRSSFGVPVNGTYGSVFNPNGADWVSLSVPITYNVELVCKPLTFFNRTKSNEICRLFLVSVFYERLSWKDANFDGLPLQRFMSDSFIKKYAYQDHLGVAIKIGIY